MNLSPLVPVVQRFPSYALADVTGAVAQELSARRLESHLPAGASIAIAAGSRGISNISAIVRAAADYFRAKGFRPFVVPAMGSHGGGTAEGQRRVLAQYGITEESAGCPLVCSMDTVAVGQTPEGIEVRLDRAAYESGGILLVNRVKWHTTFDAPLESGLMKMAAIGIGKLYGADEYHRNIVRMGFEPVIRTVGRAALATGKFLGGVAILEDAHHDTARVAAIPAARIEEEEPVLLEQVKQWMPRLLFDHIDILIVDEIGKHISGVGMDSKVINRHPYGAVNPWAYLPRILRVYVRELSPRSHGNANGLGMADMISQRLYDAVDWEVTKVNALTANNLPSIRTPLRAASDREAFSVLTGSVGRRNPSEVTFVWIRNTLELTHILASENLLADAPTGVEPAGARIPWVFDESGNLPSFAHVTSNVQSDTAIPVHAR